MHYINWAIPFNISTPPPPLRGPLQLKRIETPLKALFGSHPIGYLTNPIMISFPPLLEITKTPNCCLFFENTITYPLGRFKVKTSSSLIGYPDSSIGDGGVCILNRWPKHNRQKKHNRIWRIYQFVNSFHQRSNHNEDKWLVYGFIKLLEFYDVVFIFLL